MKLLLLFTVLASFPVYAKSPKIKGKIILSLGILGSDEDKGILNYEKLSLKIKAKKKGISLHTDLDFSDDSQSKNNEIPKFFRAMYATIPFKSFSLALGRKKYSWGRLNRQGLRRTLANRYAGEIDSRYGNGAFFNLKSDDLNTYTLAITSGDSKHRRETHRGKLLQLSGIHLVNSEEFRWGFTYSNSNAVKTFDDSVGAVYNHENSEYWQVAGMASYHNQLSEKWAGLFELYMIETQNYVSFEKPDTLDSWKKLSLGVRIDYTEKSFYSEFGFGSIAAIFPEAAPIGYTEQTGFESSKSSIGYYQSLDVGVHLSKEAKSGIWAERQTSENRELDGQYQKNSIALYIGAKL